ncbi:MAG: hybrid sensor histidine kinase/response regulator [Bdellovibrionota bacterium]
MKAYAAIKILCVDDQPANLIALHSIFKDEEYELIDAKSGAMAIGLAENEDFAVILLDVQMPVMDGYQTARLIRQKAQASATPIIFITAGYPSEEQTLEGYDAGAIDYLFKPLNVDVLRAKVAAFVELHKARVDISRLRNTEQALRKAIQVRDEFLSIASHEFKTPITPLQLQMQGFIRLIDTGKLHETSTETLRYMLEISDVQVGKLARLIEQLLNVSQIDEGRLNLRLEEVDLEEVIREGVGQLHHQLEASECQLILNLEPNIRGTWDRVRLEQVVLNLLNNSIKYAAGKQIEVSTTSTDGTAKIIVKDEGMGIAQENHLRIFERFERAVPLKNYGGLGLGLYVSREIVARHSGKIYVESKPGQGAKFTVELPKHAEAAALSSVY